MQRDRLARKRRNGRNAKNTNGLDEGSVSIEGDKERNSSLSDFSWLVVHYRLCCTDLFFSLIIPRPIPICYRFASVFTIDTFASGQTEVFLVTVLTLFSVVFCNLFQLVIPLISFRHRLDIDRLDESAFPHATR